MIGNSIRNILVIKLRAIGDVLLSTIVTKNLRLAFPKARIDYLVEPPAADVLHGNPFVDRTLLFDRHRMSGLELIRLVRGRQYDLVIDLFGNPRTALVTRFSGARFRVGFRFRKRTYAYNVVVEPRGNKVHNTQFNLDALEAIGVAIQDRNVYFQFTPDDASYVEAFLREAGLNNPVLVGINVGGGWYTKRWGLERFAELADRLVEHHGAGIVLIWGPGELEDVRRIQHMMKRPSFIPPPTTLRELGALLKKCVLLVSNDSGPMHVAAAVGTPVLGIYGPTDPKLQGPYGEGHKIVRNEALNCLGCNLTKCPIGHPCMLDLSVESVLAGAEELLRRSKVLS